MKKTSLTSGLVTLMLSLTAFADDLNEIQAKSEQMDLIEIEVAKNIALQAQPGFIEEIDLDNRPFFSGWEYEIEIVSQDGKEWEVYIDAQTGEIRDIDRDWDWF